MATLLEIFAKANNGETEDLRKLIEQTVEDRNKIVKKVESINLMIDLLQTLLIQATIKKQE